MIHVVVSSPSPSASVAISVACSVADIDTEIEPSLQEFGSLLFRQPDSIGVFWSMGPASAVHTCRQLRIGDVRNPLFALVEDGQPSHLAAFGRAQALMAGLDDIQPWPIAPEELVARLMALHRRQRDLLDDIIEFAGLSFNTLTGDLKGDGINVHLTKCEAAVLAALATRPGQTVTKPMLMLALYNGRDEPQSKIVDVYVCKLRKKIMAATGGLDCIETVWGQGHRFFPDGYRPDINASGRRVIG